jgi:uridylate kinase
MDHSLPIVVFNLKKAGNIEKAVAGKKIGTYIGAEKDARR